MSGVKTAKIELMRIDKATKERWFEAGRQVQQMVNLLWNHWLAFHVLARTRDVVVADLERFKTWRETDSKTRGRKPKWTAKMDMRSDSVLGWDAKTKGGRGQGSPPTLFNDLYHLLASSFPDVDTTTVTLTINRWSAKLRQNATNSNLSLWVSVLLGNASIPVARHAQPIPFSPSKAQIIDADGTLALSVKVNREAIRKPITDVVELRRNSYRRVVQRIVDGEYAFKGSSVHYDRRHRKWFALICYQTPKIEIKPLDPSQELYLIPGKKTPWIIKTGRKTFRSFGRGLDVIKARQLVQRERSGRQELSRYAGQATKGRGRSRATSAWTKLRMRWLDFCKRRNQQMVVSLLRRCQRDNVGTIHYVQPDLSKHRGLFLGSAGLTERSKMTWPFYQVAEMLKQKAPEYGVNVNVTKWGAAD